MYLQQRAQFSNINITAEQESVIPISMYLYFAVHSNRQLKKFYRASTKPQDVSKIETRIHMQDFLKMIAVQSQIGISKFADQCQIFRRCCALVVATV